MNSCSLKPVFVALVAALVLTTAACNRNRATSESAAPPVSPANAPPARPPLRGNDGTMMAVRFLEDRVKGDPDDLVALNKLAGYYLQLQRETGDVGYLELALRSAKSSLRVAAVDQNLTGLLMLAQAEYATHDFINARDHARELTQYEPRKS